MNIKDAAAFSGLPAKTIRYYEDVGLIRPLRDSNGYRAFRETDVHKLSFLGRARALGFTIEDCRVLLSLYEDKTRASSDVKSIAQRHLGQIAEKITALQSMHDTLSHLVTCCRGNDRPDCPILADLAAAPAQK
ncbi:MAG: Cu(I)-responsive transcriptional regulator [Pseudorhodobacter sp.]|jgi:MerR family copper efflux transcriptional regulator